MNAILVGSRYNNHILRSDGDKYKRQPTALAIFSDVPTGSGLAGQFRVIVVLLLEEGSVRLWLGVLHRGTCQRVVRKTLAEISSSPLRLN